MKNSPTAHWWQYPTSRPSPRFNSTNKYVLQLDARFEALPPDIQQLWEDLRDLWGWSADCFEAVFGVNPLVAGGAPGKEIYTGVNMSRWVQGLGPIDSPPTVWDQFQAGWDIAMDFPAFSFTWFGGSTGPTYPTHALVSAVASMHPPESGPALSRYTAALSGPIDFGVSFDLAPLFDVLPGLQALPFVSLAVRISNQGSAPFFGKRFGFRTADY